MKKKWEKRMKTLYIKKKKEEALNDRRFEADCLEDMKIPKTTTNHYFLIISTEWDDFYAHTREWGPS